MQPPSILCHQTRWSADELFCNNHCLCLIQSSCLTKPPSVCFLSQCTTLCSSSEQVTQPFDVCSSQWPLSSSSSSYWAVQLQGGSQGSGGLAAYVHMLSAFTLSCTCLHEAVICLIQWNFLWVCHEEFSTHVLSALFEGIFVIECICCMLLSGVAKLSAYRSPCTTFM